MDLVSVLKAQWDRFGAATCTVIGGLFLFFGWLGVSNTPYLVEQIPYVLSGGIGGVFFLGLGATLWISADLRDEWAKLDRIEEALGDGTLKWSDEAAAGVAHVSTRTSRDVQAVEPAWTDEAHQTAETPVVVAAAVSASSPVVRARAKATPAKKAATSRPSSPRQPKP